MRLFVIAAVVIFTVFVAVFAGSAKKDEVRGMPRAVWVWVIILTTPIGGILYLIYGRPPQGGSGGGGRVRRPIAPDDDPDFLRKLSEKLRRERDGRGK